MKTKEEIKKLELPIIREENGLTITQGTAVEMKLNEIIDRLNELSSPEKKEEVGCCEVCGEPIKYGGVTLSGKWVCDKHDPRNQAEKKEEEGGTSIGWKCEKCGKKVSELLAGRCLDCANRFFDLSDNQVEKEEPTQERINKQDGQEILLEMRGRTEPTQELEETWQGESISFLWKQNMREVLSNFVGGIRNGMDEKNLIDDVISRIETLLKHAKFEAKSKIERLLK